MALGFFVVFPTATLIIYLINSSDKLVLHIISLSLDYFKFKYEYLTATYDFFW